MSAEVSFTKRAAQELSRCFNGLTVGRAGSANKSSSASTSSTSKVQTSGSSSSSTATAEVIGASGSVGVTGAFASTSAFEPKQGTSSSFGVNSDSPSETTHLLASTRAQGSSSLNAAAASNSSSPFTSTSTPGDSFSSSNHQHYKPASSSVSSSNQSIPTSSQRRGYQENDPSPSSYVNQRTGTDLKPLVPQNKITIISPSAQCATSSSTSISSTNPFLSGFVHPGSGNGVFNNDSNIISHHNTNPSQMQQQQHNQNSPFIHSRPQVLRRNSSGRTAGTVVGGLPQKPPPPPKTKYARRKNYLLGLAVPKTVADLWLNEAFLRRHLFSKFTPKEKCVLAQVCKTWRDVVYDDSNCWKQLLPIIYCNQLRRETLNQTIISNTIIGSSNEMSSVSGIGILGNKRNYNHQGNLLIEENNADIINVNIDLNGHDGSVRGSLNSNDCLSSLSDMTPVDTIRGLLYSSVDRRGFDSVCLFGASDADIIDFASRIPPIVLKRISHGVLRCSSCSDKGLEIFLAALSQSITKLELSGCNEISDAGLWTSIVPGLRSLAIMDCINVADETVAAVTQMLPHLEELHIQAYHVTDGALNYFAASFARENLRVLKLEHCWEITNQGVVSIAQGLPNLTTLSMAGCSKITDDSIEVLAEQLRHLKSLDLSWLTRITDSSLEYIACDLSETLVELVLDRCLHVTDIGLGYIATMSKLHTLSLRWCPQLRDFGLQTLWSMRSLRMLSLAGCQQLTATGLSGLAQLQQLQELELTNCPAATPDLINYLRQSLPYTCTIIV